MHESVLLYLVQEGQRAHQRDEQLRQDAFLRIHTAKLVAAFGELLHEEAEQWASERGVPNAFERDRLAELLNWRFSEFNSGLQCSREDFAHRLMPQPHQYSLEHARSFFNLTVAYTGRYAVLAPLGGQSW